MESVFASADLLYAILRRLGDVRERARCRLVCKDWCRIISVDRAPLLWGAIYAKFTHYMGLAPRVHSEMCADGIIDARTLYFVIDHYPHRVEALDRLSRSDVFGVYAAIVMGVIPNDPTIDTGVFTIFSYPNGIRAIHEGLITLEAARQIHRNKLESLLHWNNGIVALREGFITLSQVDAMPHRFYIDYLFGEETGIDALREGRLTVDAYMKLNLIEVEEWWRQERASPKKQKIQ